MTLLTTRFDRRPVLIVATVAFVALNLLPVLVDSYGLFLGARVGTGAAQGLFIGAAITTATSIVPAERAGRAMAVVISGFATASALGVPLGTLLGQLLGWRASFAAVVLAGLAVLLAATAVLPSVPTAPESRAAGQARHAFARRVLALLGLCCLVFMGIESALTYLVPYLGAVTGVTGAAVSVFLLLYGVATTVGSVAGGRFADAGATRALVVGTIRLSASLLAMYLFGGNGLVLALAIVGVGLFGMGMTPSLQHRIVTLAGPGAPLASSLPASACNLGGAFGALAGGAAVDGLGLSAVALTGALVAVAAVATALATARIQPAAEASSALSEPEPVST